MPAEYRQSKKAAKLEVIWRTCLLTTVSLCKCLCAKFLKNLAAALVLAAVDSGPDKSAQPSEPWQLAIRMRGSLMIFSCWPYQTRHP